MNWSQVYDPLGHWWLSTLVAALPIVVLFGLLAGLKVKPHWCAIAGASTAVLVAIIVFKMPLALAVMSFGYGVAFGVLKIAWIVLAAVHLYDISAKTGNFALSPILIQPSPDCTLFAPASKHPEEWLTREIRRDSQRRNSNTRKRIPQET